MPTPPIAHFGTTLMEPAPAPGVRQAEVPITGDLARTLRFLEVLGFKPLITNCYPDVGRQYIWSRGVNHDVDYLEKDTFTSYAAKLRPAATPPRVGDTIFRLPHAEPTLVLQQLLEEDLVTVPIAAHLDAFRAHERTWLLLDGPDRQRYELGPSRPSAADNHVIYVWTDEARLDAVAAAYAEHFGLEEAGRADFHGMGQVRVLRRSDPGVTLGLLYHSSAGLLPRWTDDIFAEAGYAHFRLGAPHKALTEAASRQAFPASGDVSFVYFQDSYLELVES